MFALLAGYQYHSTAVVSDQSVAPDIDGMRYVDQLRGQPGTRVPHVWVRHRGQRVSTLDLLGPGFTLLTGDGGPGWVSAAAATSTALGIPVTVRCIGAAGDTVGPDGQWAALTELPPDGALLVRPDDFIGWRAEQLPTDPARELHQALSAILHKTGSVATTTDERVRSSAVPR